MKCRIFRRKKADLDFIYFSIGEGLDTDSQLAEDTNRKVSDATDPPAQFVNANYGSPTMSTTMSRGNSNNTSRVQANEEKANESHANAIVEGDVEPPASRNASLSRKEGAGNTQFIPSFLNSGGPPPRTDSPCNDADGNDEYFTSFSPVKDRDDILIPHLNENNSNIGSSSTPQRDLPLLVKKNKYDRGGLLSNPVHTHMNGVEVNGVEAPTTIATPLQKRNLRPSRNWSDEPPAPNRWHQVHDADDDTEGDGEEIREDFDDAFGQDPLVDDLCNQSRPVGCVSIAVTAGIAALWLL